MDTKTYFTETLPKTLEADPAKAHELGAIYSFNITGDGGGEWTVDLKADPPAVSDGLKDADCALEMANEDFLAVLENFQLAMQFFFSGKLKVKGDPMLATKLQTILK